MSQRSGSSMRLYVGIRPRPFRIMPKPAWFLTHKRADIVGRLITEFHYRPSVLKLPRIIWNALLG